MTLLLQCYNILYVLIIGFSSNSVSSSNNMSPEDYRNVYWGQLRDAIDQVIFIYSFKHIVNVNVLFVDAYPSTRILQTNFL